MHITILALGSRGDIQPYAALGRGLRGVGHHVRFITFEGFASLIAESELDFHPILGDAQALVANAGANSLALIHSFGSLAKGYIRDLSAPHLRETDLFINQLPSGLFGHDLAEKAGVPLVLASVIPLARTYAFPLMGFPKLNLPGYNRFTYCVGEQIVWLMFQRVINFWRRKTLDLEPLPFTGYFGLRGSKNITILNGFSICMVPRPIDWMENIHICGYWFPEQTSWQPSNDLIDFLEAGRAPVFIGFGSMPVRDPQRTTEIVVEALNQSGQRGIIHAGWGGIGKGDLPPSIFKIDYAPYSWLFPRMEMIIHHGGSGTTAFGIRSGVPSMAVPFVFDQFYWGERIAALDVGPKPIPHSALTIARLKGAILLGAGSQRMKKKAAELGQKIRAEDGIGNAIRIIEGLKSQ